MRGGESPDGTPDPTDKSGVISFLFTRLLPRKKRRTDGGNCPKGEGGKAVPIRAAE